MCPALPIEEAPPKTETGAWKVLATLMEAIASGSMREDARAEDDDLWTPALSPGSPEVYRRWLALYRRYFPSLRYPRAQAFLNTPDALSILPIDYLYGTSILLSYDPLEVRVLHLLDSSRFLYFQTDRAWFKGQWRRYFDAQWRKGLTWFHATDQGEIGEELRQLAVKYRAFVEGAETAEQDGEPVVSAGALRRFVDRWLGQLERAVRRTRVENLVDAAFIDFDTAFIDFSLLDIFDLSYLLELRKKGPALRNFVVETSRQAPQTGTYCRILTDQDAGFELLCPSWPKSGLIERIVTFPVSCQGFDERLSKIDDVLFVGFFGRSEASVDGTAEAGATLPDTRKRVDSSLESLSRLRSVVSLITSTSLNELRRIQVLGEARHSAIGAIMGRNLSHNIGSHVLHWLIRQDEQALEPYRAAFALGESLAAAATGREFIRAAAPRVHFLRYLRERMDYIATVTRPLGWWSYSSPLSALVGPLSIQAARSSEEQSGPELAALLRNIGRSDDVFDVVISAADEKGGSQWPDFQRLNVAVPHGAAGRQAFFTIIENIVRNSAKHQPRGQAVRRFRIAIEADARHPDLVKVVVADEVTRANDLTRRKMEKALHGWICDRHGRPQMTQLGFKEMRISAAFLRMIDPARADGLHDPDLLAIEERNGLLAHCFYLLKARDLLVVTSQASQMSPAAIQELKNLGIGVVEPDEKALQATLHYRFLVLLDDDDRRVAAWAEQSFGGQHPLPVRSFRVSCLPQLPEGCRISGDAAARLRGLLADMQNGDEAQGARLKNEVYDLWLRHNFPDRAGVHIAVFGSACSWVKQHGGEVREDNPFKDDGSELTYAPCMPTAVFAHHGALHKLEQARRHPRVVFAQDWSGGSATGSFLAQAPDEAAGELLMRELREAVLSRVLIVDERLGAEPSSERRRRFGCAGVELLGREFPTMADADLSAAIRLRLPWDGEDYFQYTSIHYGLIEKCAERLSLPVSRCAEAVLAQLGRVSRVVLVHSGRGRPDLPPAVRYVDFSSLESWFNEDKRTLVVGLGGV